MLDYSKVVQLLKKEFPSITQEEIDYMISTIPANMSYPAVKSLVKMTKHLQNNPAKMKLPVKSLVKMTKHLQNNPAKMKLLKIQNK